MRNVVGVVVAAGVFAVAVPTYADSPGKSASAAGQTGATPGASSTAPGQTGTTPGQTGATPGQSGATPPGQAGTTPGQSGTAPGQSGEPKPVPGESVVATPDGTVVVTTPDGQKIELADGTSIPVGSVIDATHGTIVVKAARPDGGIDTGSFSGGVFQIRQQAGYTDLYLRGGSFRSCRRPAARLRFVALASKRQPVRRLWGSDDGGRFRTHGRNSVATVRGTKWLTEDRCSGTLTRVATGAVDVREKRSGRVVTVRAGHSYLARSR